MGLLPKSVATVRRQGKATEDDYVDILREVAGEYSPGEEITKKGIAELLNLQPSDIPDWFLDDVIDRANDR